MGSEGEGVCCPVSHGGTMCCPTRLRDTRHMHAAICCQSHLTLASLLVMQAPPTSLLQSMAWQEGMSQISQCSRHSRPELRFLFLQLGRHSARNPPAGAARGTGHLHGDMQPGAFHAAERSAAGHQRSRIRRTPGGGGRPGLRRDDSTT